MNIIEELQRKRAEQMTRRYVLKRSGLALGALAMGAIGCRNNKLSQLSATNYNAAKLAVAKAKQVIFLHMAGAPSQLELFDYKPLLHKLDGKPCPDSFLEGKRFAFIEGVPDMLGPQFSFKQYGQSGSWVSEMLPNFSSIVDDVLFLKAVKTDEFNHAPAQLFMHTGSARIGRPGIGSWVTYGLGSENDNLPGFVVLVSGNSIPSGGKSLWGSGFLPSKYQGVELRSKGDPILYINNPATISRDIRRHAIDAINEINKESYDEIGDPEILSRMSQYELAFKMQMTVPEATDVSKEPDYIHEMYGTNPG
jgi:hypothetical protein